MTLVVFVFGYAPFILVPTLWWFAWLISGVTGREKWEVKAILGFMALIGAIAVAGSLVLIVLSPSGVWGTIVATGSWVALGLEVSPFLVSLAVNRRVPS